MKKRCEAEIPSLYRSGQGISDTFYKVLKAVDKNGLSLRTEYDRKENGNYLDPPSKDAKVMIRIQNLFAEPRIPIISYMNVGKYIAEMLGAKDHLVVPHDELFGMIHSGNEEFEPTQWPYAYHQRLTNYPMSNGITVNQLEKSVDKLVRDPITRRAIAMTGLPEIDTFMKSDAPCLRELQFRAIEDNQGRLVLNTDARWRSRDLYKAWCDNLVGLRNLIRFKVAIPLQNKTGKEVIIGPYTEENGSLHIYGQDYSEKGMDNFFEVNPTLKDFLAKTAEKQEPLNDNMIEELKELKEEKTWNFPRKLIELIDYLIQTFESGEFKP